MVDCDECNKQIKNCRKRICKFGRDDEDCNGNGYCTGLSIFKDEGLVCVTKINLCKGCGDKYSKKRLKDIPKKFDELLLVRSI